MCFSKFLVENFKQRLILKIFLKWKRNYDKYVFLFYVFLLAHALARALALAMRTYKHLFVCSHIVIMSQNNSDNNINESGIQKNSDNNLNESGIQNNQDDLLDSTSSSSIISISKQESKRLIDSRKNELKEGIINGKYFYREKTVGADGKPVRASCWNIFYEICDNTEPDKVIPDYFYCTGCTQILHNSIKGGNTNKFNRHSCARKFAHPITKEDKDKIKYAAAKFVVNDFRPFHTVEGNGFKSFCFQIMQFGQEHPQASLEDLNSVLPSRNTVKEGIREIATQTQKFISTEIERAISFGSVAIAIDAWTDSFRHESYLGIIAVLTYEELDGRIITKKYTLGIDNMAELVKSKKVIADHLFQTLAIYGIPKQVAVKNFNMVHDRGSNLKFGLRDENMIQTYCFCHIINNIVSELLKQDEVKKIIAAASDLASYIKNGGLCKRLNSTLKTFSKTRWNSVSIMFDSIIENYAKIVDILTEKQRELNSSRTSQNKQPLDYISHVDISAMSEIADFLKPFKQISVKLEGYKTPTLHKVWPAFIKIREILTADPLAFEMLSYAHIIEDMKISGLNYLNSHLRDFEPKEQHKISTILHPVLKKLPKINAQEKDDAYRIVDRLVKQNNPDDVVLSPTPIVRQPRFSEDFLNDFCNVEGILFIYL